MALTINTNIASLNAQRNLGKSQNDLNRSMERLSSGLRINSAKDDAAGLAISDRMTSQIKGLNQASRNANDGISLAQTAEGALQESTNILQRMRELAVQSANDTNSASDRQSLQAEVNQLKQEMDRIAENTSFNGRTLLDGTMSKAQFQVGANSGETITFGISSSQTFAMGTEELSADNTTGASMEAAAATTGVDATNMATGLVNNFKTQELTVNGLLEEKITYLTDGASAEEIATAINSISDQTGVAAEAQTKAKLSGVSTNGQVSFAIIGTNTDAVTVSATVKADDLTNLVVALNKQTGNTGVSATLSADKTEVILNQSDGADIKIADYQNSGSTGATAVLSGYENADGTGGATAALVAGAADSGIVGGEVTFNSSEAYRVSSNTSGANGSLFDAGAGIANASMLNSVDTINISTVEGASEAIKIVDGAVAQIDSLRGDLGAIQNRFESTISNLQNVSENLSAARSRIQDADIAMETSAMTKNNILQQAGVSILAQANQTPQLALSLLQG